MNFFSSKIEMNKRIKSQQSEIEQLQIEKKRCLNDNADLKALVGKLQEENREYQEQYIRTGLECAFCYTTLQENFVFCPKCGKKINKAKKEESVMNNTDIFQVEEAGTYVLINQYNGFDNKKVLIPSSINGKKVIGIWNSVFEKCTEIEEVFFEEGCQYIGKSVFAGCTSLKKVKLPKSLLEIGDSAFSGCAIEELAVPPNVKTIGAYAFSCKNLKKILLPDGLQYISLGVLSGASIEEINIPQSVKHIGYNAFSGTKLKEVELPDNLYSIKEYAFNTPTLKKITMHSNIKILSADIFGKSAKPIIYCAAGSKAQMYARKYGMDCREIQQKQVVNIQPCASSIILFLGSVSRDYDIGMMYRSLGLNKAETWSWNEEHWNRIVINKCMDMHEALSIKRNIQSFVNSHSDWSKPGFHCSLQRLSVCEDWGTPVV